MSLRSTISDFIADLEKKRKEIVPKFKPAKITKAPKARPLGGTGMDKLQKIAVGVQKAITPPGGFRAGVARTASQVRSDPLKFTPIPQLASATREAVPRMFSPALKKYFSDTAKSIPPAVGAAARIAPPYQVYRSLKGKPVTLSETISDVQKIATPFYRLRPSTPVVEAGLGLLREARKGGSPAQIIAGGEKGITEMPGVGESLFPNDPKAATATDVIFMGLMISRPFLQKKISKVISSKPYLDEMAKTLDIPKNASLKRAQGNWLGKAVQLVDDWKAGPQTPKLAFELNQQYAELDRAAKIFKSYGVVDRNFATALDYLGRQGGFINFGAKAGGAKKTGGTKAGKKPQTSPLTDIIGEGKVTPEFQSKLTQGKLGEIESGIVAKLTQRPTTLGALAETPSLGIGPKATQISLGTQIPTPLEEAIKAVPTPKVVARIKPEIQGGLGNIFKLETEMTSYDDLLRTGILPGKEIPYQEYFAKEKGKVGKIVEMTPDEYLSKIPKVEASKSSLEFMRKKLSKGEKLPMAMLDYTKKEISQEGRNRAYLAKELGVEKMPVLVVESVAQPPPSATKTQHQMPDGTVMAGPEHPGAVPGSTVVARIKPTEEFRKTEIVPTSYASAKDFAEAEFSARPTDQLGLMDSSKIEARDPIDKVTVADYVERISAGEKIHPIEIVKDGNKFSTVDGSNRLVASQELKKEIPVIYRGEEKIEGLRSIQDFYDVAKESPEVEGARVRLTIKAEKELKAGGIEELNRKTGRDFGNILSRMRPTKEGQYSLPKTNKKGREIIWDEIPEELGITSTETIEPTDGVEINKELYEILVKLKGGLPEAPGPRGPKEPRIRIVEEAPKQKDVPPAPPEKTGPVLEGMGTGKRFAGVPPEAPTKDGITFAKKVPFEEEGGRQIGKTFEKEIGVPISVNNRLRVHLGRFKSTEMGGQMLTGEVQVKNLDNLKTVSHEVGHYLDFALGRAYSGKKEARGILSYNKPLREELIGLTEELHGPIGGSKSNIAYRRSSKELIAEYVLAQERDPEMARSLAPEFTKVFEKSYKEDETAKFVVDKLSQWNKEFQTLIDYTESLRKIPEISTGIKEYKEKGNAFQNLYRENIGNKLWDKIENVVEKAGETKVGSYLVESQGLHKDMVDVLDSKSKLIAGQSMRVDEEIVDPLKTLSKEDSEEVAKLIQQFGQKDPKFGKLAENTQKELAVWGREAKDLGLLNDEAFWNNVGQYFPYFYSTKEFATNKESFGYINFKKLRADLSGFKHRLSDEEMGIKVLKNQFGTWPASLKKIEAISKEEKIRIGRETRKEMGLIKTAAYPVKKRLDQMIQSVYTTKALNSISKIPGLSSSTKIEGWQQLPDSKQLGGLAGQYVPKRVFDEVNQMNESKSDIGKLTGEISSIWKTLKVPMNLPTVARNIQSNVIIAWMGDTAIYNPKVVKDGFQSFKSKDDLYKALRDQGLYTGSYSKNELQQLAFAAKDGEIDKVIEKALKIYNTPGKAYGAIEDVFKTIMAKDAINKGASIEEAIKYADKWLFDYSKTSKAVDWARQGPLPFITWSAKMLPRLIETLVKKPEKYLILWAMAAAAGAYSRDKLGITKEDEERQKQGWLQERGTSALLLPYRDNKGQLQFLDLSYISPWGSWIQRGKSGLPQAIEPSNPFTILYNAYIANYDPFYQQQIANEYLPAKEQFGKKTKYVLRGFLPSLAPGGYGSEQIVDAYHGEGDYYGRVRTLPSVLLRNIAGVKIEPGGETEFQKKRNAIERQIRDIQTSISITENHQGLGEDARKKELGKLEGYLEQKQTELDGIGEFFFNRMKPEDVEVFRGDSVTNRQLLRAKRDLKRSRFPESAGAAVQKYATAEFIVSEVNKLKTAEEKEGKLQEFKESGYLTPEVREGIKMVNRMKNLDLSKADREMFLYEPGLIRAKKIIVRVNQFDTGTKKDQYLQRLTDVGLLDEKTMELVKFLNALKEEEADGWREDVMGIQISKDKPLLRVSPTPQSTVRITPPEVAPAPEVIPAPAPEIASPPVVETVPQTGERYIIDSALGL